MLGVAEHGCAGHVTISASLASRLSRLLSPITPRVERLCLGTVLLLVLLPLLRLLLLLLLLFSCVLVVFLLLIVSIVLIIMHMSRTLNRPAGNCRVTADVCYKETTNILWGGGGKMMWDSRQGTIAIIVSPSPFHHDR